MPPPASAMVLRARSTSRAGTMIRAPAEASVRAVSRPRPEQPPVTIATLPTRSTPLMMSTVVEARLKPEPMGACAALIAIPPFPESRSMVDAAPKPEPMGDCWVDVQSFQDELRQDMVGCPRCTEKTYKFNFYAR